MGARLPDIKFKEVIEKTNTGTIFLHVSRSLGGRRIGVAMCKCGKDFTFRPNDNHTGYCPDCSRMVAGKNKSKGFDVFIQRSKDAHGDRFLYDESSYSGLSSKVRIKCEKHGWFEQVANQHYKKNAQGCTKCGIDKAAAGAVSRCKTANGLRECARCREILPLDMFKVRKRIKNEKEYLRHTAYCLQCIKDEEGVRRARMIGATIDGTVNVSKVFNRDKWRCYICGTKTQKKDIMADNAAEVEHVVPLSKGGAHTYSNVRCSCRACNQSKHNMLVGQLVMSL